MLWYTSRVEITKTSYWLIISAYEMSLLFQNLHLLFLLKFIYLQVSDIIDILKTFKFICQSKHAHTHLQFQSIYEVSAYTKFKLVFKWMRTILSKRFLHLLMFFFSSLESSYLWVHFEKLVGVKNWFGFILKWAKRDFASRFLFFYTTHIKMPP